MDEKMNVYTDYQTGIEILCPICGTPLKCNSMGEYQIMHSLNGPPCGVCTGQTLQTYCPECGGDIDWKNPEGCTPIGFVVKTRRQYEADLKANRAYSGRLDDYMMALRDGEKITLHSDIIGESGVFEFYHKYVLGTKFNHSTDRSYVDGFEITNKGKNWINLDRIRCSSMRMGISYGNSYQKVAISTIFPFNADYETESGRSGHSCVCVAISEYIENMADGDVIGFTSKHEPSAAALEYVNGLDHLTIVNKSKNPDWVDGFEVKVTGNGNHLIQRIKCHRKRLHKDWPNHAVILVENFDMLDNKKTKVGVNARATAFMAGERIGRVEDGMFLASEISLFTPFQSFQDLWDYHNKHDISSVSVSGPPIYADTKQSKRESILRLAVEHFGDTAQYNMAIEELAELIVTLNHYDRGRCDESKVVEEIADVQIMLAQVKYMLGISEADVEQVIDEKSARLETRIRDEQQIEEREED